MTPHRPPGPPPALTALLLLVAAGLCTGVVLAGVLASRLHDLRADVAEARRACTCCDLAADRTPRPSGPDRPPR